MYCFCIHTDHIVQTPEQQVIKTDASSASIPQISTGSQQAHGASANTPSSQHTETNNVPGPQDSVEQGDSGESSTGPSVEELRQRRLKHLGE